MKEIFLFLFVFSFAWTQCDANGDGDLNIQDIIVEVNCIIDDCWENTELDGYWMIDSSYFEITLNDSSFANDMRYCGEYDDYYYEDGAAFMIYFNENNQGGEISIDASFCGLDEVDISNPIDESQWTYESYNDNLIVYMVDEYGYTDPFELSIETLDENNLILYAYMTDDYNGMTQEMTYWFRSVSTINDSERTIINKNNNIFSLDYKKHFKSLNAISN